MIYIASFRIANFNKNFILNMQDINIGDFKGERFIPWESTPAYTTLLRSHFNDYTNRVVMVKTGEIEEEEAEK